MNYNTVLFDWDGTLIESNQIIIESFRHVFDAFVPEQTFTEQQLKDFVGPSLFETFGQYRDKETVEDMIASFRTYYKQEEHHYFNLYPDVISVLKELKRRGYYLGIVTTKFKESAWPSFTHFDLEPLFDTFVALEHVSKPKPSAEPILLAKKQIQHATGTIMVGDNTSDIEAGKNASCVTVGVGWTFKGKDELSKANPDYMIDSMRELLDIVNELNA